MASTVESAAAEYRARLQSARAAIDHWHSHHITIGNLRLLLFLAALVLIWFGWVRGSVAKSWVLAPAGAFAALLIVHDRLLRRKACEQRRADFYERGLARMEGRWKGTGETANYAIAAHPYAADLDLFGPGSMFDLLCLARTQPGRVRLADWLLAPASPDTIRVRQEAAEELRGKLDFRECLAVAGETAISTREAGLFAEWGQGRVFDASVPLRIAALTISIVTACAILWFIFVEIAWLGGALPHPPLNSVRLLVAAALFSGGFGLLWRLRDRRAIEEFETIRPGLALLSELLIQIEREPFEAAGLRALQAALGTDPKPSRQIARLNRLSDMIDSRDNLFVRVFGPPLLWTTQVALAVEAWRARYGPLTGRWVHAVSEMEALGSLAAYWYEHPDCVCAEFAGGDALFSGAGLRHPLIVNCVANDLVLNRDTPLVIVSGSNMSGKSTLLRTVGLNAVLAQAGAVVSATSLRMSPLHIGASLRVTDSLTAGESHFSAEIRRLRLIFDLAERPGAAVFLIDEILQGTNSHDRLTGTRAILEHLLRFGAIGMITTHDLALTNLGGRNMHFKDSIAGGAMTFDYCLKPGVVQGSNALELMRMFGLLD